MPVELLEKEEVSEGLSVAVVERVTLKLGVIVRVSLKVAEGVILGVSE